MHRIVVDVQTGEQTIVPFTPEEIAAIEAAAVANPQPTGPTLEELQTQLAAIQAQIDALK